MENIKFHRATILPKEGIFHFDLDLLYALLYYIFYISLFLFYFSGTVKFLINIFEGSGEFELLEGSSVAVSGKISVPESVEKEMLNIPHLKEKPGKADSYTIEMNTNDIYKMLRLRGYDYNGIFRGIIKADHKGIL